MNFIIGGQFHYAWNDKKGMKYKTKADVTKEQVLYLYDRVKGDTHTNTRDSYRSTFMTE